MIGIVIWCTFGFIAYATTLAYFQRKFPTIAEENYHQDLGFAIVIGLMGPAGFIIVVIMAEFWKYGLQWK